jgi:tetratricopeptide (TPR) repeat protein
VLIAAAWGAEPRAGEQAREKLPRRYPYLYEFRAAQAFDPDNARLAREIAYLHLAMGQRKEAEQEFTRVLQLTPNDESAARQLAELQGRSLPAPTPAAPRETSQVRQLALASYERSYLQDALKYLRLSLELEPNDSLLQLRLAQTLNLLQRDREAMQWFAKARKSKTDSIAREADAAWRRLHPLYAPMQSTTWAFPFFSTRWRDGFGYAQSKTEFKFGQSKLRPYLSTRFVGDTGRGERYNGALPAQLSETSVILGGGAFLPLRDNLYTWGEAGVALRYLGQHPEGGRARPDYRGGAGWFRGWGKLLGAPSSGRFAETNLDAVYVSRFQHNTLFISQTRTGYSFARKEDQKIEWQALWNFNVHTDARRQYWANFVETGPGIQFRWQGLPPNLRFGIHGVRGVYLRNAGNPLRPNFFDVRVGFWYAITR